MKNIKTVKNSLKFKADPKVGLLTVRIGVKKLVLPVEARMLSGGDHLFLSFGSSSEIYKIEGKDLKPLDPMADGSDAMTALNPGRRRKKRAGRRGAAEMPEELKAALAKVPAGHKLVMGPDGYRMVKTRTRGK